MRLADLQECSFRGVRALCPHDVTEEGRNTILHHYPDAAHRYAEDNGYCPPKFDMTFVLHGRNLPAQVRALRNALNRPGPGTLQHPHYGAQFCAVVGPYRVTREDADSGVVIFEITFAVTGPPLFPGLVTGIAAIVTGLAGAAVAQLFQVFAGRFQPPRSPASRAALAGPLARTAAVSAQRFGSGAAAAIRLARDAGAIVDQPSRLAASLATIHRDPFEEKSLLAPALVTGFAALIDAAGQTAADAAAVAPTTLDLSLRQQSLDALADAMLGAAFAGLAEAMAGRDYVTADEVAADEALLVRSFDAVQASGLDGPAHRQLAEIYVAASEVLRDREVRLPRLTDISVVEFPASVLAYQLYDSDARTGALATLNPRRNPILYDGPVTVLLGSE